MNKKVVIPTPPIVGYAFDESVGHLHSLVCTDSSEETRPYHMPILLREYLVYAIALYEGCEACYTSHAKKIRIIEKTCTTPLRDFDDILKSMVLFLKVSRTKMSDILWKHWLKNWKQYSGYINKIHPEFSMKLTLLVAYWDNDKDLKEMMYKSLSEAIGDYDEYEAVLSDILRITVFMKASTAMYENKSEINKNLHEVSGALKK